MIAQTPWVERSFHFDFPVGIFPVLYSRLQGTIFRLNALLQGADDAACSTQHHGWSVKEHAGHLYDLEALWWQRLNDFKANKTILSAADMTNQKTNEANHNHKTLQSVTDLFCKEREKMLQAIITLSEDELSQTALHPRLQQPMRLVDSLFFVAEHDDHHLAIITSLLAK